MDCNPSHRESFDADNGAVHLALTVRFSASIPDLLLDISSPSTTTGAGLKHLIRSHLPGELSTRRLRLIYAGRGLGDKVPLTVSLKLHLGNGLSNVVGSLDKGKGKEPVRNANHQRVYVHCSISDIVLSEDELNQETEAASTTTLLAQGKQRQDAKVGSSDYESAARPDDSTTTPAARGFDRLLLTGFTAAEVSALRSQFLAILSVSRTPDTLPTGSELRELEDRWMDEGTSAASAGIGIGGGGGAVVDGQGDDNGMFGTESRGAMEDMLWGAVMGFFWPVGCVMWLRREEGVWSWRKGVAVLFGVLTNGVFGILRETG